MSYSSLPASGPISATAGRVVRAAWGELVRLNFDDHEDRIGDLEVSVGSTWRGAWSEHTSYNAGDLVQHDGSVWRASAAIVAASPPDEPGDVSPTAWELFASGGESVAPTIFPAFTTPADGDFAWVNQGAASVAVSSATGGIHLSAPTESAVNWRIRKKSAPTVPYTLTVCAIPAILNVSFHRVAVLWRQSSDGKLVTFEVSYTSTAGGPPELVVNKWTSATVSSANYTTREIYSGSTPLYLRLVDDNTNRKCLVSFDGENFIQIHSVGRTDFLTADEIGFGVDVNNTTFPAGLTVLSWHEA